MALKKKTTHLEELVMQNNLRQIEIELKNNPKLLQENCRLLTLARTEEMVLKLLQMDKLESEESDLEEWIGRQDNHSNLVKDDLGKEIKYAIESNFSTILEQWPSIALRILDEQIKFKG